MTKQIKSNKLFTRLLDLNISFSYAWKTLPRLIPRLVLFSCSVVYDSFITPWTVAHQAPLSTGFSKQEHWNGLPFPPPGDLPDPGIEPVSPALPVDSLPLSHLLSDNSKGLLTSVQLPPPWDAFILITYSLIPLIVSISHSIIYTILYLFLCLSTKILRLWSSRTMPFLSLESPKMFMECMVRCDTLLVPWDNIIEAATCKKAPSPCYTET